MAPSKQFRQRLSKVTELVRKDWPDYRARAGRAHSARGRGAFIVDVSSEFEGLPEKLPYYNKEDIQQTLSDLALLLRVGEYNPEREVVFAVLDFSACEGQTLVLADEGVDRSLPPIVSELPDTSRARNVDELLEMLTDIVMRRDEASLDARERAIWHVMVLKWQVDNGGFIQFFGNEGERWLAVQDSLHVIGASKVSKLFRKVCSYFPEGNPGNGRKEFEERLDEVFNQYDDLWEKETARFYVISSEMERAIWRYWKQG